MMHDFTLVLDRDPTDDEIDALYETGLDDGMVERGGGNTAVIHVGRDADTLLGAVTSAVLNAEAAGFTVAAVTSDDLVTLADIAARLGRSREAVRLQATGQRGPGGFPPPMSPDSGWALYSWAQVSAWFAEHHGTEQCPSYDRQLAAADHLVRARAMLGSHRAQGGQLLTA